jgi:hypothetical protein
MRFPLLETHFAKGVPVIWISKLLFFMDKKLALLLQSAILDSEVAYDRSKTHTDKGNRDRNSGEPGVVPCRGS